MNSTDIKYHAESGSQSKLVPWLTQLPIKLISSENLFKTGNEVLIQHRGEQYRLRLTRNDKLILTK